MIMVCYSIEPRIRKYVKENEFLSFARNLSKKYKKRIIGCRTIFFKNWFPNACDCDAYILVKDDITVTAAPAIQVSFKNCELFTKCITIVDGAIIDDAKI